MEKYLIVCPHCNVTNRIPVARLHDKPSCGKCAQSVLSDAPIILGNNIHNMVKKNEVLTIVDFWASWCQPCLHMAPHFAKAQEQLPHIVFAKLQTDTFEQASIPYNIRSLPTMVAFKGGKEVARQAGALSSGQIVQWVSSLA